MGDFPQESRPASLALPWSNYGAVHERARKPLAAGSIHLRGFLWLVGQAKKHTQINLEFTPAGIRGC